MLVSQIDGLHNNESMHINHTVGNDYCLLNFNHAAKAILIKIWCSKNNFSNFEIVQNSAFKNSVTTCRKSLKYQPLNK